MTLLYSAAAGALMLAAGAVLAQTPIGQLSPDGVVIKGKVVEDFGGKFVIADDTGRILVEPTGALPPGVVIANGETIVATGLARQKTFAARRIARENGEVIFTAAPAPDLAAAPPFFGAAAPSASAPADVAAALRAHGLSSVGPVERKKRHIEVAARDAAGRDVIASFDLSGRVEEIEDADHDNKRVRPTISAESEARDAARRAGYEPSGPAERRKHHFEVMARTPQGEAIELHVNLAGHIYKRIWLR